MSLTAAFSGLMVTGTARLHDSATGDPLSGYSIFVAVRSTPRDGSDWYEFVTDNRGVARIVMPRLADPRTGEYFPSATVYADFNTRRKDDWPYDPQWQPIRREADIPGSAGSPPTAHIRAFQNAREILPQNCISPMRDLLLESGAVDPDPQGSIDQVTWTIESAAGSYSEDGANIVLHQLPVGLFKVTLVVWDGEGLGTILTRTFQSAEAVKRRFFGWEPCSAVPRSFQSYEALNGRIEVRCVPEQGGFEVRWLPSDGSAPKYIGRCIWNDGENYSYFWHNLCTDEIERVVWRNEEGHQGQGLGSYGKDEVSDHNGDGKYQADVYTYTPHDNQLQLTFEYYSIINIGTFHDGDQGPLLSRSHLPPIEAPESFLELAVYRGGTAPGTEGSNRPGRTRLLVAGKPSSGVARLTIAGVPLTISNLNSDDPLANALLIASAINSNTQLEADGIKASAELAPGGSYAFLGLHNVHYSDVTRPSELEEGPFALFHSTQTPQLNIDLAPGGASLRWPMSASQRFQLQAGTWLNNTLSWETISEVEPDLPNRSWTLPISPSAPTRFYRLIFQ